jgi:hypothetical protein
MDTRTHHRFLPAWLLIGGLALAVAAGAVISDAFGVVVALGLAAGAAGLMIGLLVLRQAEPGPARGHFDARAGWDALHREIRRSRRYGRPFVLVATPGELDTAATLQSLLRTPDRAWIDDSIVYTLLTECDRLQALGFLERARAQTASLFAPDQFRLASFPSDAVTVGALLEALQPSGEFLPQDAELIPQPSAHTREVA